MLNTLLKLLKNLCLVIAFVICSVIASSIVELIDNPIVRFFLIIFLFILISVLLILFYINSQKSKTKRKNSYYANILKNEIKNLNELKQSIDKQENEYLHNELLELKKHRSELNAELASYLKDDIFYISKNKYFYDKQYIKQVFTDEYINKAIDFPDGLVYQNNKIIDIYSNEKYGRFTAYTAPNGKVIHFKRGCSQATIPVDITKFMHIQYSYISQGFNPSIEDYKIAWDCEAQYYVCKKCRHRNKMKFFYMPEWYEQYLKIQKLKERYNIE